MDQLIKFDFKNGLFQKKYRLMRGKLEKIRASCRKTLGLNLCEVVGQDHILGPNGFITKTIASARPLSIILWGPPGSGKTTIARLYTKAFNMRFHGLSAVFSGVADINKRGRALRLCDLS